MFVCSGRAEWGSDRFSAVPVFIPPGREHVGPNKTSFSQKQAGDFNAAGYGHKNLFCFEANCHPIDGSSEKKKPPSNGDAETDDGYCYFVLLFLYTI